MRSLVVVGLLSVAGAVIAGCSSTQACTAIGCQDQFSATVTGPGGTFAAGAHQVDVTADGTMLSCSFTFPSGSASVSPSCSQGLQMIVSPATICMETMSGGATVLRCDPIPGQFTAQITVFGTPAQVRVQQSVDGTMILDETAAPTYLESRPNGPACEPTCRQASTTWTSSAPPLARPLSP